MVRGSKEGAFEGRVILSYHDQDSCMSDERFVAQVVLGMENSMLCSYLLLQIRMSCEIIISLIVK
jgi:hypothetical protein